MLESQLLFECGYKIFKAKSQTYVVKHSIYLYNNKEYIAGIEP